MDVFLPSYEKSSRNYAEMIDSLHKRFSIMEDGVRGIRTVDKIGTIHKVTGLILESDGPEVTMVKFVLSLLIDTRQRWKLRLLVFQVNAFDGSDSIHLIHPGCKVISRKIRILFQQVPFVEGLLMAWVDLLMERVP